MPHALTIIICPLVWNNSRGMKPENCCTRHRRRLDFLQGWAKIEAPSGKRRRREVDSPQVTRGERSGKGNRPPQPTTGSGGASWVPPAGSGAEPRPQTGFWHILGSGTAYDRKIIAIIAYINCLYWNIVNIKKCPFNQFPTTENSFKNPLIRTLAFTKTKPNNYSQLITKCRGATCDCMTVTVT